MIPWIGLWGELFNQMRTSINWCRVMDLSCPGVVLHRIFGYVKCVNRSRFRKFNENINCTFLSIVFIAI